MLGHVRLADDDAARGAHPLDDQRVRRRHELLGEPRAERGAQASGRREVLDRLGHAVHPPARHAGGEFVVAPTRFGDERIAVAKADDRVQRGVAFGNAVEVGDHHFATRDLPCVHGFGQSRSAEREDLVT